MNHPIDIIIAITSTVIGTILGFLLNLIGEYFGKLHINIERLQKEVKRKNKHDIITDDATGAIIKKNFVGEEVYYLRLSFFLIVYNGKKVSIGINNCNFYITSKKGNKKVVLDSVDFLNNEKSDIDDSDEMLNIMAKTAKRVRISKSLLYIPDGIEDGFKLYITYTIVGKDRVYKKKIYECDEV